MIKVIEKNIEDIIPYKNNPRINKNAIEYVAESIKEFGFKVPLVIDNQNVIVTGHTRYEASKLLGMKVLPVIIAGDLTKEEIKAFRLIDNKSSEKAFWDEEKLNYELEKIIDIDMSKYNFKSKMSFDELGIDYDSSFIEREQTKKEIICPKCGYKIQ